MIILGKSDRNREYYRKIIKNSPKLLARKQARERRYYARNRGLLLEKKRLKRREVNPNPRPYKRRKPLKCYPPEKEKFRKRGNVYHPIIHDYPSNRHSRNFQTSDGEVV